MTYIYFACFCGFYAKVVGTYEQIRRFSTTEYPCPRCDGEMRTIPCRKVGNVAPYELTAEEFIDAVNGLGMPHETVTHLESIVAMLKSTPIVDVDAFERDERCYIRRIFLDNGVTLHLASSGYGAVVYKATRGKHANSRASRRNNKQQLRGHVPTKEHDTRSGGNASIRSEVHGRVREDTNEVRGTGWWDAVHSSARYGGTVKSGSEVVQRTDDGKVGKGAKEEGGQKAKGQ